MKVVLLEGTLITPRLSYSESSIFIEGHCIPENSIEFFRGLFEILEKHLSTVNKKIVLDLNISYLNTSSSKCLFDLFMKFKDNIATVIWRYREGDDERLQKGEGYQSIVNLPFKIVEEQSNK